MADFFADHNVALQVATLLRADGHSTVTAREMGLDRAKDDEILLAAAQRTRILATHNAKDFILLHDAWRRWSQAWEVRESHAGILVLPQGLPHPYVAELLVVFVQSGLPLRNELYHWGRATGWVRDADL